MAITIKAAGIGYHKSENFATATPCLGFIEVSKSDHVTFGGNQMSSFQNHWFSILAMLACHPLIFFLASYLSFLFDLLMRSCKCNLMCCGPSSVLCLLDLLAGLLLLCCNVCHQTIVPVYGYFEKSQIFLKKCLVNFEKKSLMRKVKIDFWHFKKISIDFLNIFW